MTLILVVVVVAVIDGNQTNRSIEGATGNSKQWW
jgi:hypothetical protein